MTESNTNDRRFWMVIAEHKGGHYQSMSQNLEPDDVYTFTDQRSADAVAERWAGDESFNDIFVVEAVSRYSVPAPKVVKQNLHIPPITAREERPND